MGALETTCRPMQVLPGGKLPGSGLRVSCQPPQQLQRQAKAARRAGCMLTKVGPHCAWALPIQ